MANIYPTPAVTRNVEVISKVAELGDLHITGRVSTFGLSINKTTYGDGFAVAVGPVREIDPPELLTVAEGSSILVVFDCTAQTMPPITCAMNISSCQGMRIKPRATNLLN